MKYKVGDRVRATKEFQCQDIKGNEVFVTKNAEGIIRDIDCRRRKYEVVFCGELFRCDEYEIEPVEVLTAEEINRIQLECESYFVNDTQGEWKE